MTRKAFVTGAAGFILRHMVEALMVEHSHHVRFKNKAETRQGLFE